MRSPARRHLGALPRCTHMEENGGAILEKSDLKVNDHSLFFSPPTAVQKGYKLCIEYSN